MDIDYHGITVEISSITAVTSPQATPSLQYYCKFHLHNRSILAVTAVLPPFPLPCRALAQTSAAFYKPSKHHQCITVKQCQPVPGAGSESTTVTVNNSIQPVCNVSTVLICVDDVN